MSDELLVKIVNQLDRMDKRLYSLERNITDIKAGQAKIENEISTKVTVLFDGWHQHEDFFASNSQQLNQLETKLDKLDLTATKICVVQEQHSKLLDVLFTNTELHDAEIKGLKRAK